MRLLLLRMRLRFLARFLVLHGAGFLLCPLLFMLSLRARLRALLRLCCRMLLLLRPWLLMLDFRPLLRLRPRLFALLDRRGMLLLWFRPCLLRLRTTFRLTLYLRLRPSLLFMLNRGRPCLSSRIIFRMCLRPDQIWMLLQLWLRLTLRPRGAHRSRSGFRMLFRHVLLLDSWAIYGCALDESRIGHSPHRRLCGRRMERRSQWAVQCHRLRMAAVHAVELRTVLCRLTHVCGLHSQRRQMPLT